MKKFLAIAATAALPFLLVWASFILTGFSFTPREVFQSGTFWGVSTLYWVFFVCILGFIVEMVDEAFTKSS